MKRNFLTHTLQDEEGQRKSVVEEIKADDNIEISNHDNEDSLNLTIGEEDQTEFDQLLRDEDTDVKSSKGKLHIIKRWVGAG